MGEEITQLQVVETSINQEIKHLNDYIYGGELFGRSWAKKATKEKQIATETDVIEQA